MNAGIIATRYARAIYEFAVARGEETNLYHYFGTLAKQYAGLSDIRKVMLNPTISNEKKIKLLMTACGAESNETLEKVIRMIVDRGRAGYMESIALLYDTLYRKANGIVIAKLTTVEPASEETKKRLEEVIASTTKDKVEFHNQTDPTIIGGFILEIEDQRLDGSVKDQLNQLRLDLTR